MSKNKLKKDQTIKNDIDENDPDFTPKAQVGTGNTPLKMILRSSTTTVKQPTPAQLSEQIKLALSVDNSGNMSLQSISGRPPSFASTERQGLHTVAWAI
jgi:hypothetical protein